MLNMTKQHKAGEKACYNGLQLNRNPFIGKSGVIAWLHRHAWSSGFEFAERNSRGG